MTNEKIIKRFKEFIETYPENMRYKVNSPNCIGLMEWSWEEGRKDALFELQHQAIKDDEHEIGLYIERQLQILK